MSRAETRLLVLFLFAVGLAATGIHAVLRWEPSEPEAVVAAAPAPAHNETVLLAFGEKAKSFEPALPAGSWRFVWQGSLTALLERQSLAEAMPGGYFVTAASLRDEGPVWNLEVVLSPWQEGLSAPPAGTKVSLETLMQSLRAVPTAAAPPRKSAPAPQTAPVPAPPVPATPPATGEILLLGTFGDGEGKHWWFKEAATDRVFEVPGAADWSLVQADGAAIVLQRAGKQYRVDLTP